jgi:hypothetical protein
MMCVFFLFWGFGAVFRVFSGFLGKITSTSYLAQGHNGRYTRISPAGMGEIGWGGLWALYGGTPMPNPYRQSTRERAAMDAAEYVRNHAVPYPVGTPQRWNRDGSIRHAPMLMDAHYFVESRDHAPELMDALRSSGLAVGDGAQALHSVRGSRPRLRADEKHIIAGAKDRKNGSTRAGRGQSISDDALTGEDRGYVPERKTPKTSDAPTPKGTRKGSGRRAAMAARIAR